MIPKKGSESICCTVVQAQVLMRPNDPVYGFGYRLLKADQAEDDFWQHTLQSLAMHFGVDQPVEMSKTGGSRP